MQAQIVNKIFEILSKNNENPKTELVYKNDFTLLVAVILLAYATDISVNLATKSLFKTCSTPGQILELGEDGLKNIYNLSCYLIVKQKILSHYVRY